MLLQLFEEIPALPASVLTTMAMTQYHEPIEIYQQLRAGF
jgi:hypothetical protein